MLSFPVLLVPYMPLSSRAELPQSELKAGSVSPGSAAAGARAGRAQAEAELRCSPVRTGCT